MTDTLPGTRMKKWALAVGGMVRIYADILAPPLYGTSRDAGLGFPQRTRLGQLLAVLEMHEKQYG